MSRAIDVDGLQQSLAELREAARYLSATAVRLVDLGAGAETRSAPGVGEAPVEAPPIAAAPDLTSGQRLIIERVLNVFESGAIAGKYDKISIFADGPNDIRQITYGRSQTTEYGNLRELVQMYVDAGGQLSEALRTFVPLIGRTALVDNGTFKDLLRRAGADPVMRRTQDVFFDRRYFQPAMRWAAANGFTRALSALVIYDSFIHSGSILDFLRARFTERPPARGGDEEVWIQQYVGVRHEWLRTHSRPAVRPSIYRTRDMAREIARNNWDLTSLPFMANGTPVDDRAVAAPLPIGGAPDDIPFLGAGVPIMLEAADPAESAEVWSELEPPPGVVIDATFVAEAPASTSAMAQAVLDHPGIKLASQHVSGVNDQATALHNIQDTANGLAARRSAYGHAPGGTIRLDPRLLSGLLALADDFTVSVSEIAGGGHSGNSRHYAGVAVDFNYINGRHVGSGHPDLAAFKQRCRDLGITELLGPGNANHSTHVHAAWPRP